MSEPYVDQTGECYTLVSGDPKDQFSWLSARAHENRIIFEIPGGRALEVDPATALQFSQSITSIAEKAAAAVEFSEKVEAGYYDWYIEIEEGSND